MKVGEHSCLKIEIPGRNLNLKTYVVYLDPTVGFNPRRIDFVWRDNRPSTVWYSDYQKVANVWFPRKQVQEYGFRFEPNTMCRVVNTVTRLTPLSPVRSR